MTSLHCVSLDLYGEPAVVPSDRLLRHSRCARSREAQRDSQPNSPTIDHCNSGDRWLVSVSIDNGFVGITSRGKMKATSIGYVRNSRAYDISVAPRQTYFFSQQRGGR